MRGVGERFRGRLEDPNRTVEHETSFVSKPVKWLMFSFNWFFWLVSLVFIGVGIWSLYISRTYTIGSGEKVEGVFDIFFDTSMAFINFGIVVFLLSLFGMLGSLKESAPLLKTYMILLIIVFLLEIGIIVAVFALASTSESSLKRLIHKEAIADYRTEVDRANFVDWFQGKFECCGVGESGYRAWESNKYFNCSSPGFEACSVPSSCCKDPYEYDSEVVNRRCGAGMLEPELTQAEVSNTIYTRGCVDAAILAAKDNILIVGGVIVAIVTPQLAGIFLSRFLYGQIEDQMASSKTKKKPVSS